MSVMAGRKELVLASFKSKRSKARAYPLRVRLKAVHNTYLYKLAVLDSR